MYHQPLPHNHRSRIKKTQLHRKSDCAKSIFSFIRRAGPLLKKNTQPICCLPHILSATNKIFHFPSLPRSPMSRRTFARIRESARHKEDSQLCRGLREKAAFEKDMSRWTVVFHMTASSKLWAGNDIERVCFALTRNLSCIYAWWVERAFKSIKRNCNDGSSQ